MAQYVLANVTNLRGTLLRAGKIVDDRQYSVAELRGAGAVLVPLPNAEAVAEAAKIDKQQRRGASPQQEVGAAVALMALAGGLSPDTHQTDRVVAAAGQAAFELSHAPTDPSDVAMKVNGVAYEQPGDYSVAGTAIAWTGPFLLLLGDEVEFDYPI